MATLSGSFGNVVNLSASAKVDKGHFYVAGSLHGVAMDAIAANGSGPVALHGVFKFEPRTAGTTFTVGAKCYSAHDSDKINSSAANSLEKFVGYALEASSSSSKAAISVLLVPEGA